MDGLISGGVLKPGGLESGILRYLENTNQSLVTSSLFKVPQLGQGAFKVDKNPHLGMKRMIKVLPQPVCPHTFSNNWVGRL